MNEAPQGTTSTTAAPTGANRQPTAEETAAMLGHDGPKPASSGEGDRDAVFVDQRKQEIGRAEASVAAQNKAYAAKPTQAPPAVSVTAIMARRRIIHTAIDEDPDARILRGINELVRDLWGPGRYRVNGEVEVETGRAPSVFAQGLAFTYRDQFASKLPWPIDPDQFAVFLMHLTQLVGTGKTSFEPHLLGERTEENQAAVGKSLDAVYDAAPLPALAPQVGQ